MSTIKLRPGPRIYKLKQLEAKKEMQKLIFKKYKILNILNLIYYIYILIIIIQLLYTF